MGKFSFDTETRIGEGAKSDKKEFFDGFSEPVEEFEIPEQEEIEPEYFEDNITATKVITEAKKKAAEEVVNIGTSLIDALLQMYSGTYEFGRYKPPKENIREIQSTLVNMLPDNGKQFIPNWLLLIVAIFAGYSPIIVSVKEDKRFNDARNQAKTEKQEKDYFADSE